MSRILGAVHSWYLDASSSVMNSEDALESANSTGAWYGRLQHTVGVFLRSVGSYLEKDVRHPRPHLPCSDNL